MSTKLTLTMEKKIIEQAKEYAARNGESLSELVANYFKYLTNYSDNELEQELSPLVKKLKGIIKIEGDFDYKQVLQEELAKKYKG